MNDELVFDLTRQEVPVKIAGDNYKLVELTGKERDAYFNTMGTRLRINPDGKSAGVKDFDGLEGSLVAASLKRVLADGTVAPVAQEVIQAWPARVVNALFKRAQVLSALADEKKNGDEEKNA